MKRILIAICLLVCASGAWAGSGIYGAYSGGLGLYYISGSGTNQNITLAGEHYTATYRPYLVVYYHLPAASTGARRLRIINGG